MLAPRLIQCRNGGVQTLVPISLRHRQWENGRKEEEKLNVPNVDVNAQVHARGEQHQWIGDQAKWSLP